MAPLPKLNDARIDDKVNVCYEDRQREDSDEYQTDDRPRNGGNVELLYKCNHQAIAYKSHDGEKS